MNENTITLEYGVSTYADVLPAMEKSANAVLTGVPDVESITWSRKIYGSTGWFEIQFKHNGDTYSFNSNNQKWGTTAKVPTPIYSDEYDGSVMITK